jgi:DNA-binding XRE family transcriptional regulator
VTREQLIKARQDAGLTRRALAALVGTTEAALRNLEAGKPSEELLARCLSALSTYGSAGVH